MYHYNAYAKPAAFLYVLRDLLGNDVFVATLQEFMRRWHGKHPTPYDFFNTFNDVSGQHLNWLFKPWFFELGYVDLAVKDVVDEAGKTKILIEKIGHYPAPVHLELSYKDGQRQIVKETAAVWKDGNRNITMSIPDKEGLEKIEIKHRLVPDADVSNNSYLLH
jgi:aminopeptidase N